MLVSCISSLHVNALMAATLTSCPPHTFFGASPVGDSGTAQRRATRTRGAAPTRASSPAALSLFQQPVGLKRLCCDGEVKGPNRTNRK
jgi:hypothetical protein